jgi:hypothetical protein
MTIEKEIFNAESAEKNKNAGKKRKADFLSVS